NTVKLASTSNRLGMATANPIVTTSLAMGPVLRRYRNTSRSSTSPMSGASTSTASTNEGTVPQCQTTRALKYIAADTYACAPKARLNTPEVLYVRTNPSAISA